MSTIVGFFIWLALSYYIIQTDSPIVRVLGICLIVAMLFWTVIDTLREAKINRGKFRDDMDDG
jgi:hypothetical protein